MSNKPLDHLRQYPANTLDGTTLRHLAAMALEVLSGDEKIRSGMTEETARTEWDATFYDEHAAALEALGLIVQERRRRAGMSAEQARQLKPGDFVRVLIDGCGDVDAEERHFKAGAFAKVCDVADFGGRQGWAVTLAIVSPEGAHVVNTFDEGDDGGRFALERLEPGTLDHVRAEVFAYDLENLNEPTDGTEPKAPTGDDYNAIFSLICG